MGASPDILLPYQRAWLADDSRVKVYAKCRRNGITWASALGAALDAADPNGMSVTYMSVTEKHARDFIADVAAWSKILQIAASDVQESVIEDEREQILTYSVAYDSGFTVTGFSSAPTNMRGGRQKVKRILDEAAYQDNLPDLLKAAIAALMWGGKVEVISTYNGIDNEFYHLVESIKEGYKKYSLHEIDIYECLRQGLYKQIAYINGWPQDEAAEKLWLDDLFKEWGEAAEEELLCIPVRSGSIYFPGFLLDKAMHDGPTVARLKVPDTFMVKSDAERKAHFQRFWDVDVKPALSGLRSQRMGMGWDFGRTSDLSVCSLQYEDSHGITQTPLVIELRNMPLQQQEQCVQLLWESLTIGKAAFDATGNGWALGERAVQIYGESVCEQVKFNDQTYATMMPGFKQKLQDGKMRLPKDIDIRQDLSMVRTINGIPRIPAIRMQSRNALSKKGDLRHGDAAVALMLSNYACPPYDSGMKYERVARRSNFAGQKVW